MNKPIDHHWWSEKWSQNLKLPRQSQFLIYIAFTKCPRSFLRCLQKSKLFSWVTCAWHSAGNKLVYLITSQPISVQLMALCSTYQPWLSEINAPIGYQEVAGHTYKWLLLIGSTVCYCQWGPNMHWPNRPTWTKTDINQSTIGIGGHVSDFLVPNGWINFW